MLRRAWFWHFRIYIRNFKDFTCYDEHDFHNAICNCKILKRDAKFDDFLQTFSSFCIQSKCFYSWYSCDNCIVQFRIRRISCDDDNLKWRRFIALNAMTISWLIDVKTRISYWKLFKYFCQYLNVATMIHKYWSNVFSLHCAKHFLIISSEIIRFFKSLNHCSIWNNCFWIKSTKK